MEQYYLCIVTPVELELISEKPVADGARLGMASYLQSGSGGCERSNRGI